MDWKTGLKKGSKWAGGTVGVGYMLILLWGEIKDERLARERSLQTLSTSFSAAVRAMDRSHRREISKVRAEHLQYVKETNSSLGEIKGMLRAMARLQRSHEDEVDSRFGKQQKETAQRRERRTRRDG